MLKVIKMLSAEDFRLLREIEQIRTTQEALNELYICAAQVVAPSCLAG